MPYSEAMYPRPITSATAIASTKPKTTTKKGKVYCAICEEFLGEDPGDNGYVFCRGCKGKN